MSYPLFDLGGILLRWNTDTPGWEVSVNGGGTWTAQNTPITDGSITTAKLADGAATGVKVGADVLKYPVGAAIGDLFGYNNGSLVLITPATAGHVLTSQGAGVLAEFAAIATGSYVQAGSAVGVTTGPTTNSTVYVDLTDMSVTLATTGGNLLAFFVGTFSHPTVGTSIDTALSLDGAVEVGNGDGMAPGANYRYRLTNMYRWTGVAAGNHTVKVRWAVGAGTATSTGINRILIVVEVKT